MGAFHSRHRKCCPIAKHSSALAYMRQRDVWTAVAANPSDLEALAAAAKSVVVKNSSPPGTEIIKAEAAHASGSKTTKREYAHAGRVEDMVNSAARLAAARLRRARNRVSNYVRPRLCVVVALSARRADEIIETTRTVYSNDFSAASTVEIEF